MAIYKTPYDDLCVRFLFFVLLILVFGFMHCNIQCIFGYGSMCDSMVWRLFFCCGHEHWHWMWFMLSRGGCARGASLSIDKIMMLPIFLFNLFLYIISVALQCVSLTLSVDQPLSSLLENLCFFFIARTFACRAVCLTIFVSELMCKRHHTLHMLHIHIHWSMPCASAFGFFYFFSGICCDWIWTTRANHIICLNISENFVTLSCGRPFIWCEIRLGSVSVCVCWTWITSIVDNNVNIQKGRVPSVYIAVGLFWVINFLCVRNHIDG